MAESEVKTFIKTYKNASSAIEQLLQQFSTGVDSGAENNSNSVEECTSHGETVPCDMPATGELGQVPGWKEESSRHIIWF